MLRHDGQMPAREMGRRLGVSEERVRVRLSDMLGRGDVTVGVVLDMASAGFEFYVFFFISVRDASVREVAARAAQIPEAVAVDIVLGPFDLLVAVLATDRRHLVGIADRLGSIDGIFEISATLVIDVHKFRTEDISDRMDPYPRLVDELPVIPGLDELDSRIVRALRQDGRSTNLKIAAVLGVSEGTVRSRIKRMLSCKQLRIIPFNRYQPTATTIWFLMLRVDRTQLPEIIRTLSGIDAISFLTSSLGGYDVMSLAVTRERGQILDLLLNTVRTMEGVHHVDTMELIELVKWDHDWVRILT
jgi:DNA-binding Lrp family transcriptional regulator